MKIPPETNLGKADIVSLQDNEHSSRAARSGTPDNSMAYDTEAFPQAASTDTMHTSMRQLSELSLDELAKLIEDSVRTAIADKSESPRVYRQSDEDSTRQNEDGNHAQSGPSSQQLMDIVREVLLAEHSVLLSPTTSVQSPFSLAEWESLIQRCIQRVLGNNHSTQRTSLRNPETSMDCDAGYGSEDSDSPVHRLKTPKSAAEKLFHVCSHQSLTSLR